MLRQLYCPFFLLERLPEIRDKNNWRASFIDCHGYQQIEYGLHRCLLPLLLATFVGTGSLLQVPMLGLVPKTSNLSKLGTVASWKATVSSSDMREQQQLIEWVCQIATADTVLD